MKMLTSIILFTVLMCKSQLTSCDHSEVNKILNSLIKRCFANEGLILFDMSKTTVLKNYKLLLKDQSENSVENVKEKLFQVTRLMGCEYVSLSSKNLEYYTFIIETILNINKKQNKETTIKCIEILKSFATEVNNMINYFKSALDYLGNLMGNYMKKSVKDYKLELQKIEQIGSTFIEFVAAHPSMIDMEVTINEEDISKIRDNINDLYKKISEWSKQNFSFVLDLQIISNENLGNVEIDDDNNVEVIKERIGEESSSKELCDNNLHEEEVSDEESSSEEDLDIYEKLVYIKKIFLKKVDKYIVKYYNNLGFKYDIGTNKTLYNI